MAARKFVAIRRIPRVSETESAILFQPRSACTPRICDQQFHQIKMSTSASSRSAPQPAGAGRSASELAGIGTRLARARVHGEHGRRCPGEGRRRQVPAAIDPVARRRRQAKSQKEKSRRRPRSNTPSARVPSRAPVESVSPSPRDKDRERQPENREREFDIDVPRRRSTPPGAGRDRPGSSTAPPGEKLKRKNPAPPAIQHTISAGAIPSAGRIRQPLAKG